MAQGHSNADIAGMMFTSISTVRKHLENIYERTGVHSRSAAVALMMPPAVARRGAFGGVDATTLIRTPRR